jgi:integrase
MPGSGFDPLEVKAKSGQKSELERFREAAHESPPHDELIGLVGVDTGLRCSAIGHLVEGWLDKTGKYLSIDVPQIQRCRLGVANGGKGGSTTERTVPCHECRERNMDKDWIRSKHKLPDGGDCWRPKSPAGYKGREIPILEDDTQRVVENYFRVHDVVAARSSVRNAVIRVAKRADLHETWTEVKDDGKEVTHHWPTTHDLRDTFGNQLAHKGFSAQQIKAAMGHSSIEQADDYVQLSGAATVSAFDENW